MEGWSSLSDSELLKLRLCDLNLSIEQAEFYPLVESFLGELKDKKLPLQPIFYLGDEWFSPEGMNAIAIPFFLAHPRLRVLERNQMMEVEGEIPTDFLRLLRHEAGHCLDHTYHFSKRPLWRKIFGSPKKEYAPETYRPQPYSKAFVQNLEKWYAQAHPDEDFAETFAVWLDPSRDWKKEYAHWPIALKKLEYVAKLAEESKRLPPKNEKGRLPFQINQMKSTLAHLYARRRKEHEEAYPGFFDPDLFEIFSKTPTTEKNRKAHEWLKRHQKIIVQSVARWTGERKVTVHAFTERVIQRTHTLKLSLKPNEEQTLIQLGSFLTAHISNYLFTGKFKRKR
jgi:hypothetical protein